MPLMSSQPQYNLLNQSCHSADDFSDWETGFLDSVCVVVDSFNVQEEFDNSDLSDRHLYSYMEAFEESQ